MGINLYSHIIQCNVFVCFLLTGEMRADTRPVCWLTDVETSGSSLGLCHLFLQGELGAEQGCEAVWEEVHV